jgi:predicted MPP superfamily phosphohydrolase
MTSITWLHLSDLHMRASEFSDALDQDIVLDNLFVDIKKQIEENELKPDLIFFSGDIAHSGKAKEFETAAIKLFNPLLEITGVEKDKLFIVPGNHDVDWERIDPIVAAGMREELKSRRNINEFLGPRGDRRSAFRKFDDYAKFVESYFGGSFIFDDTKYFYTRRVELSGYVIGILGLNSSWMSACHKNASGRAQDKGNLLLGEIQLRQALDDTDGVDYRIVILHHPLEWLNEEVERFQIERQIEAKCNFILHGHWHDSQFYEKKSNSGDIIYIPTGALYQGVDYPNGYNLVQFDLDSKQGKIFFRRYYHDSAKGPVWMKDIVATGESKDGINDFKLADVEKDHITTLLSDPNKVSTEKRFSPPNRKKKILFAENRPLWQQLVKKILQPDFEIDIATSYEDAKTKLNDTYSTVIINLCLETDSDFLGEEILQNINCMPKPIPCIVLTGSHLPLRGILDRYSFLREVVTKGMENGENFQYLQFLRIVKEVIRD